MSLIEYLAYPDDYKEFKEVKKVIARYVAHNVAEYKKLLNRFFVLTGKKDESTDKYLGYRTRIVHIGERLEDILPNDEDIDALFVEPDNYIRTVMDHMLKFSDKTWDEYLQMRNQMEPYKIN